MGEVLRLLETFMANLCTFSVSKTTRNCIEIYDDLAARFTPEI